MQFFLTSDAVVVLTYIILSLIILFYLLKLKDKSTPTKLLILFFMGTGLYFATLFFFDTAPPPIQLWFRPLQYIAFLVVLVFLLKFAYAFPHPLNSQRVEAKIVFVLSILTTLTGVVMYVHYLYVNISGNTTPGPTPALLVMSLFHTIELLWCTLVFLRRTIYLSHEESKRSPWQILLKPRDKGARAVRAFSLLLAIPLAAGISVVLSSLGIFSQTVVTIAILLGMTYFYFASMVVYLNHAPESSTFMVKLVGASLVIVMVFLGTVTMLLNPFWAKTFQNRNVISQHQTIRFQPAGSGYEVRALPSRFDSQLGQKLALENRKNTVMELGFTFPFCGKNWTRIHLHKDGIVSFAGPLFSEAFLANRQIGISPLWLTLNVDRNEKSGVFQKTGPGKLTITWFKMVEKGTGAKRTLQLVLSRDGSIEFNYRDIKGCYPLLAGLFSGTGYSSGTEIHFSRDLPFVASTTAVFENFHQALRRFIHQRTLPLAGIIILAGITILAVFPSFFKSILVDPLQALLEGVKQVKQGRLSAAVPVRSNDEIGFLTDSFNHMVQSLKEAKDGWFEAVKVKEKLVALNQAILDTAAEGIISLDREGSILSFNKAAEEMFKYPKDEVMGRPDHILLNQRKKNDPLGFLGHFLASGKIKRLGIKQEFQGKKKDGQLFPLEFAISDTLFEGEDIYTVILHDLSEHKQLIEEKMKLEEQLHQSQKLETIGTLAGGIAHDFNNILTPLIGYTELAMEHIPPDNAVHNYLNNILHSSNRAKNLVKQILSFSRKSERHFEAVDIYMVVQEAVTLLRASTPASITFNLDLEANSGAVLGDPTQLEQVLINICTNAAHAMMPDGGTLYIKLGLVEVNETLANQHPKLKQETYVMLQVTDTGKGMDQETQTHIFEPFFTSKPVGEGTGLGLSVVHGIVDKHDGVILVESQPGKGTTFKIYIPSIPAEDRVEMVEHEKIASPGKGNILLVDDEKIIVEMYTKWLEKIGYNVTAETNSLQARETFLNQGENFDLVITDQAMPNLTGMQLAKDILALRPHMPIILYTGNTNSISVKECREMGVAKILMKPINFATLNRSIKELLEPLKKKD